MKKKTSDILKLFDNFKCDNFPYKDKNGNICWVYSQTDRYYTDYKYYKYLDNWIYYYNNICRSQLPIASLRASAGLSNPVLN